MNFISANFTKGNSYWKFNNSLLNDIECVRTIKETIKRDKLQYASNIQLNNKSLLNSRTQNNAQTNYE